MAIEYIIDAVAFLKQEYGDISPMALAHSKGILLMHSIMEIYKNPSEGLPSNYTENFI